MGCGRFGDDLRGAKRAHRENVGLFMDDVMKTKGMALLMWERFADSRGCGGKSAIGVGIWEISYRGGTHFTVSERRDCGGWSRYNIPAGMALILWAGIETHFEDYGCEPLVMAKASPFGR